MAKQADYSVQKAFKIAFIMTFLFFCNPFIAFLVFKSKGAIDITYSMLLSIYGYSYSIFIPVIFAYILAGFLYRLKIFILLVSGAISLYYLYKETGEFIQKYLDEKTYVQIRAYSVGSTVFFLLLFRYYFI